MHAKKNVKNNFFALPFNFNCAFSPRIQLDSVQILEIVSHNGGDQVWDYDFKFCGSNIPGVKISAGQNNRSQKQGIKIFGNKMRPAQNANIFSGKAKIK